jgi:hypothetical protein
MEAKLLLFPWLVSILDSSIALFRIAIRPFAEQWSITHRSPSPSLVAELGNLGNFGSLGNFGNQRSCHEI